LLNDPKFDISLKTALEEGQERANSSVAYWANNRSHTERESIMQRLFYFSTMYNGYLPWNEQKVHVIEYLVVSLI